MLLAKELLLFLVQQELIVVMNSQELGPAMIDIVFPMPQIEVQDIDRDHLDDLFIAFRSDQVFGDGFGGGEQDPL